MYHVNAYRTYNCSQINAKNIGERVKVVGWLHAKRNHGALFFGDIRDHFGLTQVVIDMGRGDKEIISQLDAVSLESVIQVVGTVAKRLSGTERTDIPTGEIEIVVSAINILSFAEVLPIHVVDDQNSNETSEQTRLKYRFLDLRRSKMHSNISLRSEVLHWLRNRMHEEGFTEVQTPILTASSPEGAKDYLVPSRLHKGKFYALPQAPQQFKQLLMVSGFNKYFQIAPCFRDEDARADRAPGEFYQLDVEMSFVEQEDVFQSIEPVIHDLFAKFGQKTNKDFVGKPFARIKYQDAIKLYGTDKPDLRNPLINKNVTEVFRNSGFGIFATAIQKGCAVIATTGPKTSQKPRSFFDNMIKFAQTELKAKGLAYITFEDDGTTTGPIAKLLKAHEIKELKRICENGDTLFFSCDMEPNVYKTAGAVRIKLDQELNLVDKTVYRFCWITDFPYFEKDKDTGKIEFSHNPFSMPKGGLEALKTNSEEELLAIESDQYDIVCNGIELSSGAIRNHLPEVLYRGFEITGYSRVDVDTKFSALIQAFKYGAPPHGGIAPGFDRIMMLLTESENIRDVIAFPLNGQAEDLLMQAPNFVGTKQLTDIGIDPTNMQIAEIKQSILEAKTYIVEISRLSKKVLYISNSWAEKFESNTEADLLDPLVSKSELEICVKQYEINIDFLKSTKISEDDLVKIQQISQASKDIISFLSKLKLLKNSINNQAKSLFDKINNEERKKIMMEIEYINNSNVDYEKIVLEITRRIYKVNQMFEKMHKLGT